LASVAANGGEYLVAWRDSRNAFSSDYTISDTYGTRISAAGTVLDPAGIKISNANWTWAPAICAASSGSGYFVAWPDGRLFPSGFNNNSFQIYGARVTSAGVVTDRTAYGSAPM